MKSERTLTLEDEVRKGREASRLVENPLWTWIWTEHKRQATEAWATCKDPVQRESLWMEVAVAQKLRGKLERMMKTGVIASQQLAEEEPKH